ncbi:hypothetical protein AOLI_G00013280 [Acnodon oligacanthus]
MSWKFRLRQRGVTTAHAALYVTAVCAAAESLCGSECKQQREAEADSPRLQRFVALLYARTSAASYGLAGALEPLSLRRL